MPMKWRWLIHGYFDPALELSRKQRREVWRRARRLPGSPWRYVGLLVLSPSLFLGMAAASVWATIWAGLRGGLDAFGSLGWSMISLACFVSAIMLSAVVTWLYVRRAWRSQLLRALQSMGYEVCGRCGYSLRGLAEDTLQCPECGADREQCVCPHCKARLPFRGARGMTCPECGHELTEGVPEPISWLIRWLGYPTADPRLHRAMPGSARRALRRRALVACAWWDRLLIVVFGVIFLAPFVIVVYLAACLQFGLHESLWATGEWVFYVFFVAWAATFVGAWAGLGRVYGRPLRRALRQEGYEVCIRCGHWLRDLSDREQRCPVCGAPREAMGGGG